MINLPSTKHPQIKFYLLLSFHLTFLLFDVFRIITFCFIILCYLLGLLNNRNSYYICKLRKMKTHMSNTMSQNLKNDIMAKTVFEKHK